MFGKKKREAEARALAEAQARAAKAKKGPSASWQKVGKGPVPVARPADYIQLTPIVQPSLRRKKFYRFLRLFWLFNFFCVERDFV